MKLPTWVNQQKFVPFVISKSFKVLCTIPIITISACGLCTTSNLQFDGTLLLSNSLNFSISLAPKIDLQLREIGT